MVSAGPSTLVRIIERQCSTDSSRKPRVAPKPALAKTASIRPNSASARAARVSTWSHSVTSQATGIAASGPPSSVASSSSTSRRRAASTNRYRSAASRAVAAPIPLLAPVIKRTGFFGSAPEVSSVIPDI
jgi:hypothetical protein